MNRTTLPRSIAYKLAPRRCETRTDETMSTITTILEPDADGTVHVPVPKELRRGKVRVTATFEAAKPPPRKRTPKQMPSKNILTPLDAFEELRKLGGLSDIIPDPVAWQREQRIDRPLPGRD